MVLEDLETAVRRKRLRFLRHMFWMDRSRLNKQIFSYIWQLSSLNGYTKQLKEEMMKLGISLNDCVAVSYTHLDVYKRQE